MQSNNDLWKWITIIVLIVLVCGLSIFFVVSHYSKNAEFTKEQMERIKKERDESQYQFMLIQREREELVKRNEEIMGKLKEREEVLDKTLLELDRLSRETDEKISNPPSLDIDAIGSWIKGKITSTGTISPP